MNFVNIVAVEDYPSPVSLDPLREFKVEIGSDDIEGTEGGIFVSV
jgi:hypothetical protein